MRRWNYQKPVFRGSWGGGGGVGGGGGGGGDMSGGDSDILDLAINHTLLVFSGIWLKWVQSTMNQILHKTSTTKQPMMCTYACMNDFLGGGGCLCRTDDISKSVDSPVGSLSAIIATSWKYAAISTSCHMCLFAWKLCRTIGNRRRVFYVICLNWNTRLLSKL